MDGTPIYDIKPYLKQFDSHPDAVSGFVESSEYRTLEVDIPKDLSDRIPEESRSSLIEALVQDPRPHYQDDPDRVYGMKYADLEIKFKVCDERLIVIDVS